MANRSLRRLVYATLFKPETAWQRIVGSGLALLIILNVLGLMLETVPEIQAAYGVALRQLEWSSVSIFTGEYLLRLWSVVEDPQYRRPIRGRLRWTLSFFALLDLAAILPSLLPMLLAVDLRMLRLLRVLRILAFLRLGRYSAGLQVLGAVFMAKRGEIGAMLLMVLVLLLLTSSTMYYVEHDQQPESFGSIPESLWWGIITLTTVGYGDVHPMTPLGKVLGGLIALLGIGVAAMPAGILASGLYEEMNKRRRTRTGRHDDDSQTADDGEEEVPHEGHEDSTS